MRQGLVCSFGNLVSWCRCYTYCSVCRSFGSVRRSRAKVYTALRGISVLVCSIPVPHTVTYLVPGTSKQHRVVISTTTAVLVLLIIVEPNLLCDVCEYLWRVHLVGEYMGSVTPVPAYVVYNRGA